MPDMMCPGPTGPNGGKETVMTKTLRRWRSERRYRATLRELNGLSAGQLRELGIRPAQIQRLAREAALGG